MNPLETNTRIKAKLDGVKKQYKELANDVQLNEALRKSSYYFLETQLAASNKRLNNKIRLLNRCVTGLLLILILILIGLYAALDS